MPPPAKKRARVPQSERRSQLLDTTLTLLAEEGFERLSVEAIARRAGVNRVVVYRSFANLQLLLVALLRREQARVERQIDALVPSDPGGRHPRGILLGALGDFLAAIEAEPLTWRVALSAPESAPVALRMVIERRRAAIERRLRPLVAWGITQLALDPASLDEELVSRMVLSLGEEHGRLMLEGGAFTRERLLRSAEQVLRAVPWASDH
jgi:AcrR family transcriptional regulator